MPRLLDETLADIRYGARVLFKSPTFTIIAILTLAIGIGANTVIFSQVNAVLLRTLPVKNPEQLQQLEWTSKDRGFANSISNNTSRQRDGNPVSEFFSYPAYLALRDNSTSFSDLACFGSQGVNVGVDGHAEWGVSYMVSGNYFRTLGADALMGRTLEPDDDKVGGIASAAVLSYSFWQRAIGGDAGVLGKTITVNAAPFVVVGVMPRAFYGVDPGISADVTVPITMYPAFSASANAMSNNRNWSTCHVVGRLKAEVPEERARAESEVLVRQAVAADPPSHAYDPPKVWLFSMSQGLEVLRSGVASPLLLLMTVVGIIMLVACANVSGLLLARATARQKEVATRLAVGGSRGRLVRQLLTESLLLSLAGGVFGIVFAYAMGPLMPTALTNRITFQGIRPLGVDISPDSRVLFFSIGLSILTGLAFGLAPALSATRIDLLTMMKQSASRSRFAGGKVLVAIQVGLSLLLLIGAGLFIRTLVNLRSVPLGFDPQGLLIFRVNPALNGYKDSQLLNYFENAIERLEATAGTVSVSLSQGPLLGGGINSGRVLIPGYNATGKDASGALYEFVAPRYFETWKIPLLLGRDIRWSDREGSPKVVVVNEAFARKYYGTSDPVGQQIQAGGPLNSERPPDTTIVGVVADSKYTSMKDDVRPTIYLPYRQQPLRSGTIVIRTKGDPAKLLPDVRRVMVELDSTVSIIDILTEAEQVDRRIQQERQLASQLILFGSVALLLCALGIYGMLAYTVSRRTSEIGLRMALGAQRPDVIRMIVLESLAPVAVGIGMGLLAALGLTRLVESMLFGVKANDPLTIVAAAIVFLIIAAIAAFLPARRASRIEPLTALRYE